MWCEESYDWWRVGAGLLHCMLSQISGLYHNEHFPLCIFPSKVVRMEHKDRCTCEGSWARNLSREEKGKFENLREDSIAVCTIERDARVI